jgi:hypothetical protein
MSNALGVKERPTTVTILVDRELRSRLEHAAAASERSLGAEVRVPSSGTSSATAMATKEARREVPRPQPTRG